MERVGTLINKLKEQFDQQAGAEKLTVTAQLLLAELQRPAEATPKAGRISVVMPSFRSQVPEAPAEAPKAAQAPQPVPQEKPRPAAVQNWMLDAEPEVPTLTHHTQEALPQQPKTAAKQAEFNTALATHGESLNEKLREEKTEVATALQGTPVRDLRKAIGINDRFLFVNELFRGDENMYERSIKTINAFTIYAEAEYWIQRELKVKLSWPDNSDTVKLFDQLIKRRFS